MQTSSIVRSRRLVLASIIALCAGCGGASSGRASSATPGADGEPRSIRDLPVEELERLRYAVGLIDAQQYDDAIRALDQLLAERPDFYVYGYEKALAYYRKGDVDEAIALLRTWCEHEDVDAMCFSLMGSGYDDTGRPALAISMYEKGLERFPDDGHLRVNLGITQLRQNDLDGALGTFEMGIARDPMYPSNYYWATKLYEASNMPLWALIYGEIFLNVEGSDARRRDEVARTLHQLYVDVLRTEKQTDDKGEDTFVFVKPLFPGGGQQFEVQAVYKDDGKGGQEIEFLYPFGPVYAMIFTTTYTKVLGARNASNDVSIADLHELRSQFLEDWSTMNEMAQSLPNALLVYHRKLRQAGLFEAYNHWIFRDALPSEAGAWFDDHPALAEKFADFLRGHERLQLDQSSKFARTHYPNP